MKLPKPKEESIHKAVATYLKTQYPKVMFRTDFAAGIKMTMGQAMKHKTLQSGRAWPDLFIAYPIHDVYYGLFLELKRDGVKLLRDKDAKKVNKGETKLRKTGDWFDDHIEEQATVLLALREQGYKAEFAVGFESAKSIIDKYIKS